MTQNTVEVTPPQHVPAELIWDHDYHAFVRKLDLPYDIAYEFRDRPEIVWARECSWGKPGWLPTRYDIIEEVYSDHKRFSADNQAEAKNILGVDWPLRPIELDPPEHGRYRKLLQSWFQPSEIAKRDTQIRETCRELIATFEHRGKCDFISEFSIRFPSHIFMEIMGMPHDRLAEFHDLEAAYMDITNPQGRVEAARGIMRCMKEVSEEKRKSPDDKLISYLVTTKLNGQPLDEGELVGMCMLLFFGGLDTVIAHLGWYMRHLALDPKLQDHLRHNLNDIPKAVEELLRFYASTSNTRTVTEDFEFHGVQMKAGDIVGTPIVLANRDPRKFEDPDTFRLDRPSRHLAFATGAHNCLGSHLARREACIVLEEFLTSFSSIQIAEQAKVEWDITGGSWGLHALPLTLKHA